MSEQRIQQNFIDSADLKYHAAQALSKPIDDAVQALVACVTSGGKVLACGHGPSQADAQRFAALFVCGDERERPELSALALASDATWQPQGPVERDASEVYARQIRALGHPGDVLLVIAAAGQPLALQAAVQAAHERDMMVLALTGQDSGRLGAGLRETDVHIRVPHERLSRVQEVQLLVLHCLCDGVDTQLLGELENS